MTTCYEIGDKVTWNWGDGEASGEIQKTYTQKVTLNIKGMEVTRNASDDSPAYKIEQADGDIVLKAHSEVSKV